jgi:hypothetical protein
MGKKIPGVPHSSTLSFAESQRVLRELHQAQGMLNSIAVQILLMFDTATCAFQKLADRSKLTPSLEAQLITEIKTIQVILNQVLRVPVAAVEHIRSLRDKEKFEAGVEKLCDAIAPPLITLGAKPVIGKLIIPN